MFYITSLFLRVSLLICALFFFLVAQFKPGGVSPGQSLAVHDLQNRRTPPRHFKTTEEWVFCNRHNKQRGGHRQ